MAALLDINLLPLARLAGEDQPEFHGLHIAEPPRRTARGRGSDRLILYLSLVGNAPLSPGKTEQILTRLAKTYYETPGSATAAMRTIAEALNQFLLDRNVRNASTGRQATGLLMLVALRGELAYLAQCGPVHAFSITAGKTEHLYDPSATGRGLGLSRSASIRFLQIGLQANDTILLATQPSPNWNPGNLSGLYGQGPEGFRRRLLNQTATDLNAVLLQAKPGQGKVNLIRPRPIVVQSPPINLETSKEPVIQPPATTIEAQTAAEEGSLPPIAVKPGTEALSLKTEPTSQEVEAEKVSSPPPLVTAPPAKIPSPPKQHPAAPVPTQPKRAASPLKNIVAGFMGTLANGFSQLSQKGKLLLNRLLPSKEGSTESPFTLPPATMAFIAIAVPLVVVAVASMVYFRRGREGQYRDLYNAAQQSAIKAVAEKNPQTQRKAWLAALQFLENADVYRVTAESKALRVHAQNELDVLDLIKRVNFQPAIIGGLQESAQITRILVVGGDLYLLDASEGNILHALDTFSRGFELDMAFQCGPTFPGAVGVGPLIDIVPTPPNSEEGVVLMAMDATGKVLYCFLNDPPKTATLYRPSPAPNWGKLAGFTLDTDTGNLYLLDPEDNSVWIYWSSAIDKPPQRFFSDVVPPLKDVVDLAVNHDDLYLLNTDGHLALCSYSDMKVSPTRCTDPVNYIDFRLGNENQPLLLEDPFTQVQYTSPPDPSLYFLRSKNDGIYHFSLRSLEYQNQYLPLKTLPRGQATAFALNNMDRILFIALGNQVYYANIP